MKNVNKDEEQFENEKYLTHIDHSDEWFNFRNDMVHQIFNSSKKINSLKFILSTFCLQNFVKNDCEKIFSSSYYTS